MCIFSNSHLIFVTSVIWIGRQNLSYLRLLISTHLKPVCRGTADGSSRSLIRISAVAAVSAASSLLFSYPKKFTLAKLVLRRAWTCTVGERVAPSISHWRPTCWARNRRRRQRCSHSIVRIWSEKLRWMVKGRGIFKTDVTDNFNLREVIANGSSQSDQTDVTWLVSVYLWLKRLWYFYPSIRKIKFFRF